MRYEHYDADGNLISSFDAVPSAQEVNGDTLRTKAQQALATNATYLALATPTNLAQNAAQVRALSRQVNGLIRLLLGALNDVSDT